MDKFSFFFAFYGLILGLAVTELLSGFARLVRARVSRVELQTGLLALLTFLIIVATWIEAWTSLQSVTLDLAGLWAPVLVATSYYLAASVVFPSESVEFDQLAEYYASRKRFVVAMLIAAEVFITVSYRNVFEYVLINRPAEFWVWMLPFKAAIFAALIALYLARSRRANLLALGISLVLFTLPYWQYGLVRHFIGQKFGYPV